MMYFCRQIDDFGLLQKRAVFNTAPASAPAAPTPPSQEILAYRESIEDKNIDDLKTEFDRLSADNLRRQQVIMEVVEDLNAPNANVPQAKKNALILAISAALEENNSLLISDQLKFSLGSHFKPSKPMEWLTKVSLMAGTMGAMSENMGENATMSQKISGMMKWFKVLMTIIKGGTVAAPEGETSNATTNPAATPGPAPEAVPALANKAALENIRIIPSAGDQARGFIKVAAPKSGQANRQIKVKFDGSSVEGGDANESHALITFFKTKATEMKRNTTFLGKTNPGDQAKYAQAVLEGQQEVNKTAAPVDVSALINDNASWLLTQAPYSGNKNTFFQALITKPASGINPVINALKVRYDSVRSSMATLDTSKKEVKQKFEQLTRDILAKTIPGNMNDQARNEIKSTIELGISNARSLQNPQQVYGVAMNICTTAFAQVTADHENSFFGGAGLFGSGEERLAAAAKIQETGAYFSQKMRLSRTV
jgi:hypothetical protein